MESDSFQPLPAIEDEDIFKAARLLGIPERSFHGNSGTDPRVNAIKSMETIDIAACPGSGKTTLLVAKLAILSEKWKDPTRGICVISHTNAARHEIERKLGNSTIGQRLLSYPHFIGTIHGFVNEFLAVPYLRSLGYLVRTIDSDITQRKRWNKLNRGAKYALQQQGKGYGVMAINSTEFGLVDIPWGRGKGKLGKEKDTYKAIQEACREAANEGFFCFEDMFLWANHFLDSSPDVSNIIRDRFPILFIDEAQDNSKTQNDILFKIFNVTGKQKVIRQRLGDGNQAIYDSMNAIEADQDKFPGQNVIDLPQSHRFGQTIADVVDPLGLNPYTMIGSGPEKSIRAGKPSVQPTIFLFEMETIEKVLDAYGALLHSMFSEEEILSPLFKATAIGQIHKPKAEESQNFPQDVTNYWPDYNHVYSKSGHKRILSEYIASGFVNARETEEASGLVQSIAEGVLQLMDYSEEKFPMLQRRDSHRYLSRLLENKEVSDLYINLVAELVSSRKFPDEQAWDKDYVTPLKKIAEAATGSPLKKESNEFLKYRSEEGTGNPSRPDHGNVYKYTGAGIEIPIQVGSIHSVKGQTHTATLVLDTFWYTGNLESLLPWLLGKNKGRSQKTRENTRLKIHYVAMSRPTHLLCLAMKESSLSAIDRVKLESMGWNLVKV